LSVWFCYGRDHGLNMVLLEVSIVNICFPLHLSLLLAYLPFGSSSQVHNTFGERHVYVLRTGVDEDHNKPPKCDLIVLSRTNIDHLPPTQYRTPMDHPAAISCLPIQRPLRILCLLDLWILAPTHCPKCTSADCPPEPPHNSGRAKTNGDRPCKHLSTTRHLLPSPYPPPPPIYTVPITYAHIISSGETPLLEETRCVRQAGTSRP
jgi:hypothetical protein